MTAASKPTTRERILIAASELFAENGYSGTTTREISRRVGIRQPSMFHHFHSKAAILEQLLSFNIDDALTRARTLACASGPAAPRLYEYLVWDLTEILRSPYNLSGIYDVEILNGTEFESWAKKLGLLFAAQRQIVAQGVESGEFVEIDPGLAQEMIAGLTLGLIRRSLRPKAREAHAAAEDAAAFTLRGLLADPSKTVPGDWCLTFRESATRVSGA